MRLGCIHCTGEQRNFFIFFRSLHHDYFLKVVATPFTLEILFQLVLFSIAFILHQSFPLLFHLLFFILSSTIVVLSFFFLYSFYCFLLLCFRFFYVILVLQFSFFLKVVVVQIRHFCLRFSFFPFSSSLLSLSPILPILLGVGRLSQFHGFHVFFLPFFSLEFLDLCF